MDRIFQALKDNIDTRKNLVALKDMLRSDKGKKSLASLTREQMDILSGLLKHEDAKVRKNAALILGMIGHQERLQALFDAYLEENQLFVRSSYLTAIRQLDYRSCLTAFKSRISQLEEMEIPVDAAKHLNEELRILRELVMTMEKPKGHVFSGGTIPSDVILLTSAGMEEATMALLTDSDRARAKALKGGVSLRTDAPAALMKIRTYKDMLFRFCKNPLPARDYAGVAQTIWEAGIYNYIRRRHESGSERFYFRLDLHTRMVLAEKSQYVKRLAAALEKISGGRLVNSASNYEVEIRINENKNGQYLAYLKFGTFADHRFDYRIQAMATSMHPVRAAEVMALAGDILNDQALVLDPFCGSGTLLIERRKAMGCRSLYGVDLFGQAIKAARENAEAAGVTAYFINRNCDDFTHDYLFDEVITEPPSLSEHMTEVTLYSLYRTMMMRMKEWLKPGGYAVICTTQEKWLLQLAQASQCFEVVRRCSMSGKRETSLVILRYQG